MKLDKIYYEFFALAVLKDYDAIKFRNIKHSDSPDLKVSKKIGIEVTQLGTEQEFRFLNIVNRIENNERISQCDLLTLSECGYELSDGMLISTAPHDEENVFKTITGKIQKLAKGTYKGFEEYGLFMFFSDTLESITINDVIKTFKKRRTDEYHFSEIYILWSTDLYVYNSNSNKLEIYDLCGKMKKYRIFAINKQRDFHERKNVKVMKRFISDCHFGHANLNDKMDKRGFSSVEEMDEYMIKQWNSVVKKTDEVYILGDISFYDGKKTNEILRKLNGKKYLIEGNHDYRFLKDKNFDKNLFEWVKPYAEVNDNGRKVVCSHYPNIFYNGQYRTNPDGSSRTYMAFGHIHITQDNELLKEILKMAKNYKYFSDYNGKMQTIPFNLLHCFCMFSDYMPLTLDEWIEKSKCMQ